MNSHPIKVNPLPPQAFTKETLQKAYAWLLHQSTSVKDMATTQDMLISLYLKAQRNGDASLETPSIQNFKQELKNIASMMGDFHTPSTTTTTNISAATSTQDVSAIPNQTTSPLSNHSNLGQLDLQSLQILGDVKQSLNLSSDMEALRALISLGYKQFKKMT